MSFSKPLKTFCCLFLSLQLSNLPTATAADHVMIPTADVVAELDRAQTEQKIQEYIGRADVQKALLNQGVSPEEVSARLASLSESELRQLAGQLDQARAGGDILVAILIIVLIIFLIKRM